MYNTIFRIGNIIFFIMLGVSFLLLLYKIICHIFGLIPSPRLKEAKKDHKFVLLIPARNESKVIESLLKSIEQQEYNSDLLKTYVIVESELDPTCEIVKKYKNTEIFVRKHLELKGKGHALNEVMEYIFEKEEVYDAVFIFDADNVLDKDYIKEMNKAFDAGYGIALGYRNSKNWNGGWVASCSALTFSMINTFHNKFRSRFHQNVILSGTGFYIDYKILKSLGGWKFYTLTEDYELSLYSALTNIKCCYNEYAEFYDEQPTKLRVSWNQRLRWVKGYTQASKKYMKKLIKGFVYDKENKWNKAEYILSIIPIMSLLVTVIGYLFFTLILGIFGSVIGAQERVYVYMALGITLFSVYLFFVLYGGLMLIAELKHSNMTIKNRILCCLMMPIFLGLYIPLFFTSLFKKQVEWKPIIHCVEMKKENEEVDIAIEEKVSSDSKCNKKYFLEKLIALSSRKKKVK